MKKNYTCPMVEVNVFDEVVMTNSGTLNPPSTNVDMGSDGNGSVDDFKTAVGNDAVVVQW